MLNKLALGSAQFGSNYGIANKTGKPSQDAATSIIKEALASGISSIDTAQAYGNSEEVIGLALKELGSNALISTKLSPNILDSAASESEIIKSIDSHIEKSLQALNIQKIDVMMLHRWKHFSEQNGIVWKRLLHWKNKGVINKLGGSLVSVKETLEALNQPDVEFIQIPFNILDWRFRSPQVQAAIQNRPDIKIQARSAFLQGVLLSPQEIWPPSPLINPQEIITTLEQTTTQLNRKNVADLCLAYLRSLNWIDGIVIGMETLEQLLYNIDLFKEPLLTTEQISIIENKFTNAPEELLNPSLWHKTN